MNPQSPSSSSSSEAERDALLPCPFCGAGESRIDHQNMWTGMRNQLVCVHIRHWCEKPSRSNACITANTEEEAIAAWNHRATPPSLPIEIDRSALIDLIEERLTAVYHCTRVWAAWQFGTMTDDDFVEARGTDLAPDIADAVISYCNKKSPSLPIDFKQASEQGGWQWVPKEPTPAMLDAIVHSRFPEDWQVGKRLQHAQAARGSDDRVPPQTEYEIAVGQYQRMLAAAPSPHPEEGALLLGGDEGGKKGGGA